MPNGPYRTQLVSHVVSAAVRIEGNTDDDIPSMDECQKKTIL